MFTSPFPLLFVIEQFTALNEIFPQILPEAESVPQLAIPLQAIEIATLLAQRQSEEIPARLETLLTVLQQQPEDFRLDWTFHEMKLFISASDTLLPSRSCLLAFFSALEADHRDAILQGVRTVQAQFTELQETP